MPDTAPRCRAEQALQGQYLIVRTADRSTLLLFIQQQTCTISGEVVLPFHVLQLPATETPGVV